MGINSSKNEQDQTPSNPRRIQKSSVKHIRLLILHHESLLPPRDIVYHICDVLNAYTPPGSLEVKEEDVKVLKFPDSGPLPHTECTRTKQWITEWLNQNGTVLVCLLSQCNHQSITDGINLQHGRIITFSFQIRSEGCIYVDVDQNNIMGPQDLEAPLQEVVTTIQAD